MSSHSDRLSSPRDPQDADLCGALIIDEGAVAGSVQADGWVGEQGADLQRFQSQRAMRVALSLNPSWCAKVA